MKTIAIAAAALATATLAAPSFATAYTYAGSWNVSDGPSWSSEPDAYTGQEAAALLFGGKASDYAISTVNDQASAINYDAWYSVIGASGPNNGAFEFAQNYVSPTSTQAPGKYYSGGSYNYDGSDAASSYVADNAYGNVTNYAFRAVAAVPESSTWMMMILGFGAIGATMRRKQNVTFSRVAFA